MRDLAPLAAALAGLGHVTRLQIAMGLHEAGAPLSPRDLQRAIRGPSLGALAHHVHAMARAGLIRQTHVEPVRGAAQHFYELTDEGRRLVERLELRAGTRGR